MAKAKARVGSGIPGFGDSKGSTNRIWKGGEFLLQMDEVTAKDKENDDGDIVGMNVRIQTTCLGGPTQDDDTEPKGKKINLFINVNYDLPFTVDQIKDLFNAAGVKTVGDEPPWGKLAGKKIVGKLSEKVDPQGTPRQRAYFVAVSKSKGFSGKGDEDEE